MDTDRWRGRTAGQGEGKAHRGLGVAEASGGEGRHGPEPPWPFHLSEANSKQSAMTDDSAKMTHRANCSQRPSEFECVADDGKTRSEDTRHPGIQCVRSASPRSIRIKSWEQRRQGQERQRCTYEYERQLRDDKSNTRRPFIRSCGLLDVELRDISFRS